MVLFGSLVYACRKNPTPPADPGAPGPATPGISLNADTISNHLQFFKATKKQGAAPKGPTANSLKISFEDTLYLTDKIKRPIKFLHQAITDVAGVYVQVHGAVAGGSAGTFYYDVPELQETAGNDTVSVIMIGVDPVGLIDNDGVPPAGAPSIGFTITITPYGKNGQPLAEADRPVKISKPQVNPDGNAGSCSIITAPGDYWDWEVSYIVDPSGAKDFIFYNSPDKIWGKGGQDIKGSCCKGTSIYGFCPGDTIPNASLHFNTFFNYTEEIFKFIGGGTFVRLTGMFSANAKPNESNFCVSGDGVIKEELQNVTYNGNWTINHLTRPVNGDSLSLTLQGTSSFPVGSGYGNPGGRIHILDCYLLVLIQPDNEVPDRDLVKFYNYRDVNSPYWYPFN